MTTFAVTPFSMRSGVNAPTIFVDADKKQAKEDRSIVPNLARAKSGLGRFESWDFNTNVVELRTHTKRRKQ